MMSSGVPALDRVLSGGFVPGSVTLLGGEPGIGKSTLLAQVCLALAGKGDRVLYVSGEESPRQIERRLRRLSSTLPNALLCLESTRTEDIVHAITKESPALTIIDSIQTLRSDDADGEPGHPSQIKVSSAKIAEIAKQRNASVVLVGQVTKEGDVAGPRLLEHLVDTLLMMEGDRTGELRLLRTLKHRFGATDPIAVFVLTERGLEDVPDPSARLLAHRPAAAAGSVVSCFVEGNRPLLVEIQALVTPSGFATPTRRSVGVDANRLTMVIAVLGRHAKMRLHDQDIFVNVVGGFEPQDPSVDLAIALAICSAKADVALASDVVAWGEIGLAGELRPVARNEARINEAAQHGFTTMIASCGTPSVKHTGVTMKSVTRLAEAIELLSLSVPGRL